MRDKYLRERKAERDRKKSGAGATSFKRWKYMATITIQKEKENTLAVDEDEHFMLSLVPSLRRLSNQKRAQARMRMQQVLYDVEFGE